jgi:exonuclease III
MKIATYNILKGGSKRVHWLRMIEDYSVDLLLVQETYHHQEHLPRNRYPTAGQQSVWQMVKDNGWGSAVYSASGSVKRISVSGFAGWVVGAEIQGAKWQAGLCESLLVFSVHAPANGKTYAYQVNKILDKLKRNAGGREIVIGGDFNITISGCRKSERPARNRNLQIQTRLADEFGLVNCWQAANPNQPLSQTLRWTGNRMIPYHCDGLFVPQAWLNRLTSCVVLAGEEWNDLSDHNPVVADFS